MHMHFDGFDDEQWDEFKWEAHLNEVEKKSEQLRKFISSSHQGNTPRWITLLKESQNEDDAFEAFVEEELLMDEAYFPEEDDDWEEDEDDFEDEDFLFGYGFKDDLEDDFDDFDDYDEGEEWKSLTEDYMYSDFGSLEDLKTYFEAKELAVEILRWSEQIPTKSQSNDFQEFVNEVLKIGAKIAGGHSFGFEPEYIGANIAYSKKALNNANRALEIMQNLKKKSLFQKKDYIDFHEKLYELRNDIGIYIQELRDQFRLGLE